jgi:DNA invertase Pin-like site-specific DNA recombinase
MRLLGYTRVSTDEQAEKGHSLTQQRAQFETYCALYGYQLAGIVSDEGVSGSKELETRAGGRELLNRLAADEADGVLIRDLDRLFRLTLDGLNTFAWFDRRGLAVHSINERIDTDTPEGKLALTIRLATCEFERNKTAQRTQYTMQALKDAGRVYGHIPYGMVEANGHLFKHPELWQVRCDILAMRDSGMSLREICSELTRDHIAAPRGGRIWNVSTLLGIIKSHHAFDHIEEQAASNVAPPTLRAVP